MDPILLEGGNTLWSFFLEKFLVIDFQSQMRLRMNKLRQRGMSIAKFKYISLMRILFTFLRGRLCG